jgi:hypothetical protein
MNENHTGAKRPSDAEISEAFVREQECALAFAKITRDESALHVKKEAARARLMSAREEKRALLVELMAV